MNYFVTAIDTDSGKTFVSSILCEALQADYWKPVQAGSPHDTDKVKSLVSNKQTSFHAERHILKTPASPHAAAKIDGVKISLGDFIVPSSNNRIVIEGAGGCLVPLNDSDFVIDLAKHLNCEVVVVSDLYLGSINHTLLTAAEIKRRGLFVKGIIFNGEENAESQRIIAHHTGWKTLLHIEKENEINKDVVKRYANELMKNWND